MIIVQLGLFALGMFAIVKGADLFTDAAVWIAERTGVPKVFIGATIVSLATTLPEFAVSVYASWTGYSEMALGNAIGSNIFNIGLILGISLLIRSCPINSKTFFKKSSFLIIAGVLSFIFSLNGIFNQLNGIILFLVLIGYILYILSLSKKERSPKKHEDSDTSTANLLKFIGGSIAVVIGSRIVVNSGVWIAEYFKIPEILIALTLVALGTSLPELVTSITATLKGYQDLSIGNIIGAGVLNLSWVTATSAIINPIPISKNNLIWDFPFMLILMLLLMFFGLTKKRLTRIEGISLLLVYVIYISIIVGRL